MKRWLRGLVLAFVCIAAHAYADDNQARKKAAKLEQENPGARALPHFEEQEYRGLDVGTEAQLNVYPSKQEILADVKIVKVDQDDEVKLYLNPKVHGITQGTLVWDSVVADNIYGSFGAGPCVGMIVVGKSRVSVSHIGPIDDVRRIFAGLKLKRGERVYFFGGDDSPYSNRLLNEAVTLVRKNGSLPFYVDSSGLWVRSDGQLIRGENDGPSDAAL